MCVVCVRVLEKKNGTKNRGIPNAWSYPENKKGARDVCVRENQDGDPVVSAVLPLVLSCPKESSPLLLLLLLLFVHFAIPKQGTEV